MAVASVQLSSQSPASARVEENWEGRAVEKMSIDVLSHWKEVVHSRIVDHRSKARVCNRNTILYFVAAVVYAAAALTLVALSAIMQNAFLILPVFFIHVPFFLGFYELDASRIHNRKADDLINHNEAILKSEEEFARFVSVYKKQNEAPKVTEDQFIKALDLYRDQKKETASRIEGRIEFLKSEFVY